RRAYPTPRTVAPSSRVRRVWAGASIIAMRVARLSSASPRQRSARGVPAGPVRVGAGRLGYTGDKAARPRGPIVGQQGIDESVAPLLAERLFLGGARDD